MPTFRSEEMVRHSVSIGLIFCLAVAAGTEEGKSFWRESDEWSPCSVTCGEGIRIKEIFCTARVNGTFMRISKERCLHVPEPKMSIIQCHQHKCLKTYSWKSYHWSSCSHPCGDLGFQTRDVDCLQKNDNSKDMLVDEVLCDRLTKPVTRSICNRVNCKPAFVTTKWGPCTASSNCKPGNQVRDIRCSKLFVDGSTKFVPIAQCYKRGLSPPLRWRKCFVYPRIDQCGVKAPRRKVKFNMVNTNLYQMRQSDVVNLEIGQVGYLLPYSKVSVSCSIDNSPLLEIQWSHRNETFKYSKKRKGRIRVDKSGKLRIRKLGFEDQGEWKCIADESFKSTIIKIRNPSSGFRDWAIRSNLWKGGMLSEESVGVKNYAEVMHWVKSEWSICSVTCSGEGSQYREVQCEKVKLKTYEVLEDSECEDTLKSYPPKVRSCHNSVKCPEWHFNRSNEHKCLTECLNVGKGTLDMDLKCFYLEQDVPVHLCDITKRPDIQCNNDVCQLDWRVSTWTKCSKSCGGIGFQARHLSCVWKHSRKSASSLCHDAKLPIPPVVRSCLTKPCSMGCVDLSPSCIGSAPTCYNGLYRYLCCRTCRKFFRRQPKRENK